MCVCVWCTSVIKLGCSSVASIDFLIGKLDSHSSSLPPHPPVCSERKPAEFTAALPSAQPAFPSSADSSRFPCHQQSSASVIKGLRCLQGKPAGLVHLQLGLVSALPSPATPPACWHSWISSAIVWQECRLPAVVALAWYKTWLFALSRRTPSLLHK